MYVTVPMRRQRAIEAIRDASSTAIAELRDYARAGHGRFLIFGSTARGDLTPLSDFDVLVDFTIVNERAARDFVEETCRRLGLRPDAHLLSASSETFVARASRHAIVLS